MKDLKRGRTSYRRSIKKESLLHPICKRLQYIEIFIVEKQKLVVTLKPTSILRTELH